MGNNTSYQQPGDEEDANMVYNGGVEHANQKQNNRSPWSYAVRPAQGQMNARGAFNQPTELNYYRLLVDPGHGILVPSHNAQPDGGPTQSTYRQTSSSATVNPRQFHTTRHGSQQPQNIYSAQKYDGGVWPLVHPLVQAALSRAQQQSAPGAAPAPAPAPVRFAALAAGRSSAAADAPAVVPDARGRRPKPAQVSQELIDAVAATVRNHSSQAAKNKQKKDLADLRGWLRQKYVTPHLPEDIERYGAANCSICQKKIQNHHSLEGHILNKHLDVIDAEIPAGFTRPDLTCPWPDCTAMEGNYRPDALTDHLSSKHGVDVPEKTYSTDRSYIKRKAIEVLQHHIITDGKRLNGLKEGVRGVCRKLAERIPNLDPGFLGLDLTTTYRTDAAGLPKTKEVLTGYLLGLRTDGSKKGRLLCQPGQEGTWEEVLADLRKALERVQKGQAPAEESGEEDAEGEDED